MCHFVSATLPRASDFERVASLPDLPLRFVPVSNPVIERQLLPGEAYFELSGLERGGCYCGTVLGAGTLQESRRGEEERRIAKKAARLRKRGWGEAKTQAWLDQRRGALTGPRGGESGRDEARQWLRFIELVLTRGEVAHVGLLLHFYRRDVANESFVIRFDDLTLEEMDEARLRRLDEDVLYRISI